MKNVVRALICISISLIVLDCTNDEKLSVQGKVQFAVGITSKTTDGGRIVSTLFPDGAYVSLSIETASHVPIYTFKHVDLIKLGDGYVTAPLDLTEGNYRLTDFIVFSQDGIALYVSPKEGSDLAELVTDPLPLNFSVTTDGIANLNIQVVDVDQQTPEDFGYVSFGVEVAGSDYAIAVFVGEGNELSLASAKLELYRENNLVYEQNLDAKVNAVNFKGDPSATYTLFVIKEGYTIKTREYVLSDLLDGLDRKPLTFMLEPAFTIRIKHHAVFDDNLPMTFNLSLVGEPGTAYDLNIDWGDGTVDSFHENFQDDGSSPGQVQFILHFYNEILAGKPGVINITGDISHASFFYLTNRLPLSMTDIDLTRLTNLDGFAIDIGVAKEDTPANFDISGNLKLSTLATSQTRIKFLDISNHPLLTRLAIAGSDISNENVNGIIMDLPERVGIYSYDFFNFGKSSNSDQQNLAILTQESRLKLINLRDNYGWHISPNPQ